MVSVLFQTPLATRYDPFVAAVLSSLETQKSKIVLGQETLGAKSGCSRYCDQARSTLHKGLPRIRWARLARGESGSDLAGAQRLRVHLSRAEGTRRAVFPEIS